MHRQLVLAFLLGATASPTLAQEPNLAKQRQVADENLRKLEMATASFTETGNFIVIGPFSDAMAKKLAVAVEQRTQLISKTLQFEKDQKPWPGKLALYVLDDKATFRKFIRTLEGRSPEREEDTSVKLTGETPHMTVVASSMKPGRDTLPLETQLTGPLASALLKARAGTAPLPDWLVQGFGRASAAQVGGVKADRRANARKLLAANVPPTAAWATESVNDETRQLAATYVADYLIHGRAVPKVGDFLSAFRRDGDETMPADFNEGPLKVLKLSPEQFTLQWQKWLKGL